LQTAVEGSTVSRAYVVATAHTGQDIGRRATARAIAKPILFRRLLITCPATGVPTDTGFELSEVPSVAGARQLLVDCLECGQDHEWGVDDVVLERPLVRVEAAPRTHS
jgi:hypothetical protein